MNHPYPSSDVSYNQPKFDAYATWSANALTFANINAVGSLPFDIFIDTNNTVYVTDQINQRIQIWFANSSYPAKNISVNLLQLSSIFVDINGDIYVSNNLGSTSRVEKRSHDTNNSTVVINVDDQCFGLFVDVSNVLYCSISQRHKVVAKSLDTTSDTLTVVAGTDCNGSTSNKLSYPRGIFVDTNLNLYVADSGNNRIQLFRTNQLDAETIEINGRGGIIALSRPTAVVLDADEHLFIVDHGNNRIIGSGPNGFRCVVGCYGNGAATNELSAPVNMAFDSHGNIFVVDLGNHRIQKFPLLNISLGKFERPKRKNK